MFINSKIITQCTFRKIPRTALINLINISTLPNHLISFFFRAYGWAFSFENICFRAYSSNNPNVLSWESLLALFEHVRVTNVKVIKHAISIYSDCFILFSFSHKKWYFNNLLIIWHFNNFLIKEISKYLCEHNNISSDLTV